MIDTLRQHSLPILLWTLRCLWLRFTLRPVPISSYEVGRLLLDYLPAGSDWVLTDANYMACSAADFERVRKLTPLPRLTWVRDSFDCDNFAEAFRVLAARWCNITAVGLVDDTQAPIPHAYNIVILADDSGGLHCRYLEPQRMAFFEPGAAGYGVKPLQVRI